MTLKLIIILTNDTALFPLSCFNDSFLAEFTKEDIESESYVFDLAFLSQPNFHKQSLSLSSDVMLFVEPHKCKFTVGLLNINALISKFDEIVFLLNKQLLDFFLINESKLDDNDDDSLFNHSNYLMLRRDRTSSGGGIVLYIKKNITIESVEIHDSFEIISIIVTLDDNQKQGIIAGYRSNAISNVDSFIDKLESLTINLINICDGLIILGDLNINMLISDNKKLLDFCHSFGYHNTIFEGTRLNL